MDFAKLLKATKGRPCGLGQHTGILSWSRLYARELGPVRVNELTSAMVDAWHAALAEDVGAAKARDARKRLNRILLYAERVGLQVGPAPAPRPLSNESTLAEVSADYVRTLESRGKKYTKRPKTWERHYMGTLGGVRVVDLTEAMIDAWHEALIASCGPAKADRAKKSGLYPVLRHAHMRGLSVLVERPVEAPAPTPSLTPASTVAQVCADLVRTLRERARSEDEEIGRQNFQAPLSWSRHYMRGLGPVRVSDVTVAMVREWYASLEAEHQPRTAKAQLRKLVVSCNTPARQECRCPGSALRLTAAAACACSRPRARRSCRPPRRCPRRVRSPRSARTWYRRFALEPSPAFAKSPRTRSGGRFGGRVPTWERSATFGSAS